jgi:hypothetical protein
MASPDDIGRTAENYESNHGGKHIGYGTGAGHLVCNQFVGAVIRDSVDSSFREPLADDFLGTGKFVKVDSPRRGDLVHWPGHVGIVTDPDHGFFWGAQTSTGVARSNFKSGYWGGQYGGQKPDYFLRWSP